MNKTLRYIVFAITIVFMVSIHRGVLATETSATSNTTTSSMTTTTAKSSNANLTTLGITPKQYDFSGFSKNKTSYSVTVPNTVNSVQVAYKTASPKAKVKITGNTSLDVGTNIVKVVVTAEDGTKKTYTIRVTKLATEDAKPGNLIDEDVDLDLYLTKLDVKGLTLTPEFKSDVFSYETTIDMDKNDMSSVTVEAVANKEKATVEVTGNEKLVEGENLINIIVKSSASTQQTVYQITVNKVSSASEVVPEGVVDGVKEKVKSLDVTDIILIVLGIAILVVIILIIKAFRNRKNENDYYDARDYYDDWARPIDENENNMIEHLYNQRNDESPMDNTITNDNILREIQEENDRIFNRTQGETIEYNEHEVEEEDYIEKRRNKRRKGKHF